MSDRDYDFDPDGGQGDLPPPDWGRVLVHSRAMGGPVKPVGDPTRWGGSIAQVISAPVGIAQLFHTSQFLRAQTADNYGRLWALTGTLALPPSLWLLPVADWQAWLEITQGSGQTTITQFFDLRTLTTLGLAGGYAPGHPTVTGALLESRSFAIVGGVIGQQWAARMLFLTTLNVPVGNYDTLTSVIASVLAAGTGL